MARRRKDVWLWIRVGDRGDYESEGGLSEIADRITEALAYKRWSPRGLRLIRWIPKGLEVEPSFTGHNYISLFWGDREGNFVRDLSPDEQKMLERALFESRKGPKDWLPPLEPGIGAAKKRRGKEWSPRGGHPPSYTRENPPPVDVDLATCEVPGELRVSIAWIGEGLQEEFDPGDPTDIPILRFTVDDLRFPPDEHGWRRSRSYQDNSFATRMPATLPLSVMESVCEAIARSVSGEESWKRRLEEWSWVDEKEAREIHRKRMK